MKHVVLIVLVIAIVAGAGALLWFLYLAPGPSEQRAIQTAREDLRATRESLRREYPDLPSDPEKFFQREGRNGFHLCVQLEDKIGELNEASHDDERGDWWLALEYRDDAMAGSEAQRKQLLQIALTQSDSLMPDVREIVESDYILVLPDSEHRYELSPVYRVTQLLSNRCWAQLFLGNIDSAKKDAEICCRFCALVDRDSMLILPSLYNTVRTFTVGALFDVSKQTRDNEWFSKWSVLVLPESSTATALRSERVNIFRALEWTAETPVEELQKSVESGMVFEYRDGVHVLESAGQFAEDYFRMIAEFENSDLDLLNPETNTKLYDYIDKLGNQETSFSAYATSLLVESLEENALLQRYTTLSIKLRKLELAGVELTANSDEVAAVTKGHPGIRIDWSQGVVFTLRQEHPRHDRGALEVKYHYDKLGTD